VSNDTNTSAIAASGVDKSFGPVRAVAEFNLTVKIGETVALLGPNGAGKTTAISMLLGLLRPDRGTVRLFGQEPDAAVSAGLVGATLQDGGLMPGARVGELLAMLAGLYPSPMPVRRAVTMAQLDGLERRRVDRLSGGQTQRLRVAVALVGNPELLVLDEPTAAMDVEARHAFWRTMEAETSQGRTILFSTHNLDEADSAAGRVVVLGAGRVLADGTPSSIKESVGMRVVSFEVTDLSNVRFATLPGVEQVEVHHQRVELRSRDSDATLRAVLARWPAATDIEVSRIRLEDAFLALTGAAS